MRKIEVIFHILKFKISRQMTEKEIPGYVFPLQVKTSLSPLNHLLCTQ